MKVRIEIYTDNAIFAENGPTKVAEVLRDWADGIIDCQQITGATINGRICDREGVVVGFVSLRHDEA